MSRIPAPLLETIAGLLRRTFGLRGELGDLSRFVIGDDGYRAIYARREIRQSVGSESSGARTLVRETADGVAVRVYFPDALIARLEAFPPQRGVGRENIDEFAAFVEEIDHLLLISERVALERSVSLLELELHANISKHLVLARFLAGRAGRLSADKRHWLHHRLFEQGPYVEKDPQSRRRYREADRWAVRLLRALESMPPAPSLRALRRFHAEDGPGKIALIRALVAA